VLFKEQHFLASANEINTFILLKYSLVLYLNVVSSGMGLIKIVQSLWKHMIYITRCLTCSCYLLLFWWRFCRKAFYHACN